METQIAFNPLVLQDVIYRTNGGAEVSATWTKENLGVFRFIDVREAHELAGPLGGVEDVENIPLQKFLDTSSGWDRSEPVVLICRSGRRSALATAALERAGFEAVASVEGGMLAWNLQVLGQHDVHAEEKAANAQNLEAALFRTNGPPEVTPTWVAANLGRFKLVDVREPGELVGPMGRIMQSENVPLGQFLEVAPGWDKEHPIVVQCASGGRSGRAAMALESHGFTRVASLEGGMIAWRGAGLSCA